MLIFQVLSVDRVLNLGDCFSSVSVKPQRWGSGPSLELSQTSGAPTHLSAQQDHTQSAISLNAEEAQASQLNADKIYHHFC